jgi:hypothetical protein
MAIYFGRTIAEKLTQANAYYAADSHINHFDWSDYTDDEKKAGLTQAEREVDLYLGIILERSYSNTSFPISEWDNYRPDYAIFEHALFILSNTARKNTAKNGVVTLESDAYQKQEKQEGVAMSPQAERFIRINRIRIERG